MSAAFRTITACIRPGDFTHMPPEEERQDGRSKLGEEDEEDEHEELREKNIYNKQTSKVQNRVHTGSLWLYSAPLDGTVVLFDWFYITWKKDEQ